jgi:hypothetical protein
VAYSGDDLTPLLIPGSASTVGWRQGVVVAFNKLTLENTIRVAGSELHNLPILGVGETTMLDVGDVVGILVVGPMMAIVGQLVIPASAAAGDAISLNAANTYSANTPNFESSSSVFWHDLSTIGPVVSDVRVGPSGRCLVWISAAILIQGAAGQGQMAYEITGATTVGTGDFPPSLSNQGAVGAQLAATRCVLQEGLNPGLHTFTAKYITESDPGGSVLFGQRNLTVMAL